jgi:hypothetical protein
MQAKKPAPTLYSSIKKDFLKQGFGAPENFLPLTDEGYLQLKMCLYVRGEGLPLGMKFTAYFSRDETLFLFSSLSRFLRHSVFCHQFLKTARLPHAGEVLTFVYHIFIRETLDQRSVQRPQGTECVSVGGLRLRVYKKGTRTIGVHINGGVRLFKGQRKITPGQFILRLSD